MYNVHVHSLSDLVPHYLPLLQLLSTSLLFSLVLLLDASLAFILSLSLSPNLALSFFILHPLPYLRYCMIPPPFNLASFLFTFYILQLLKFTTLALKLRRA